MIRISFSVLIMILSSASCSNNKNEWSVLFNGKALTGWVASENPWRSEEHKGRLLGSGTFALQAHDPASTVYYKSIKVKRLPDSEKSQLPDDEKWETTLAHLMDKGFPVVDYHVHLKGGLTLEEVKENSLKPGINYGLAPNCGLKFPVTDDVSLAAYMDTVKGQPIFRGMQAEGRELGKLDYCLQMIVECGLTPDDIFVPETHEEKPVLVKGLPSKITG